MRVRSISMGYINLSDLSDFDQAALPDSISSYQSSNPEDGYFLYIGQDNGPECWPEFSAEFVAFLLHCELLEIEYLRISA